MFKQYNMKFSLTFLSGYKFLNFSQQRFLSYSKSRPPWNILFFGADDFSLFSLKSLLKEYRNGDLIKNLEVCTTVKGNKNTVQAFAEREKLNVKEWPVELNLNDFDVGLVVSFGHLIPKKIIEKFPLGMLNVHASLLPRWRGAAPIIYSLANGESVTGISIMKIKPKKFDEGEILMQESVEIPNDMYMPELYQKLGELGAKSLLNCLQNLPERIENAQPQSTSDISYAPKIDSAFSYIDWKKMSSIQIYNLERALKGFMPITTTWNGEIIKLFNIKILPETPNFEGKKAGFVVYDKTKNLLKILSSDLKFVSVESVQLFKKKHMTASDFNNGYLRKTPIEKRYFI